MSYSFRALILIRIKDLNKEKILHYVLLCGCRIRIKDLNKGIKTRIPSVFLSFSFQIRIKDLNKGIKTTLI